MEHPNLICFPFQKTIIVWKKSWLWPNVPKPPYKSFPKPPTVKIHHITSPISSAKLSCKPQKTLTHKRIRLFFSQKYYPAYIFTKDNTVSRRPGYDDASMFNDFKTAMQSLEKLDADYLSFVQMTIFFSLDTISFRLFLEKFTLKYQSSLRWNLTVSFGLEQKIIIAVLWIGHAALRQVSIMCPILFGFIHKDFPRKSL